MNTHPILLKAVAATCTLFAAFSVAAAEPQERRAVDVDDYAIYVDLPTAFAFIKLPSGWKFVGKLDVDQLRHLPAETLTSLLTDEPTMVAGRP